MKTITCPSKEVPVIAETQVLVVGSGPAGISAAVASARCGAKTMLVERYGCFGGALFVGQVESYTWYFNKNTYTAVSYTHLDVYKRQTMPDLPDRRM